MAIVQNIYGCAKQYLPGISAKSKKNKAGSVIQSQPHSLNGVLFEVQRFVTSCGEFDQTRADTDLGSLPLLSASTGQTPTLNGNGRWIRRQTDLG